VYYQDNQYFSVPPSCAGAFGGADKVDSTSLYQCHALARIANNFTSSKCDDSFSKVCRAAYTDNPPYSCTQATKPDFLTTLGSALGNASALWSLTAILITVMLRRLYPGGVLYRNYHTPRKHSTVVPTSSSKKSAGEGVDSDGNNASGKLRASSGSVEVPPLVLHGSENDEQAFSDVQQKPRGV
jgi:hypothetical protein